jgi:hypothetical protein
VLNCGISSAVECNLAKVEVTGSNPVFRSKFGVVVQLGERFVRNEEVRGSTPLGSTKFLDALLVQPGPER